MTNLKLRAEKKTTAYLCRPKTRRARLEEYIYHNVKDRGWLWCCGIVFRAVDFCLRDGSYLLQIKNKYNSENSSSSAIRTGTNIQKWYRLKKKILRGVPHPVFYWNELNVIVNQYSTNPNLCCAMPENDYANFLKNVVGNNKKIVSDL